MRHYPVTESTNDRAAEHQAHAEEGWAFLADEQTQGRGSHGRRWLANPRESVLLSILLNPPETLSRTVVLCAFAAVAVRRCIAALTGRTARFKWPNDLLIDDFKVAGLLVERLTTGQRQSVVIGVGLNLNQTADTFTERALPHATSLRMIVGREYDSRTVAESLLDCFDALDTELCAGSWPAMETEWRDGLELQDREAIIECIDDRELRGRIESLSFDAIQVKLWSGETTNLEPERIRHIWPASPPFPPF